MSEKFQKLWHRACANSAIPSAIADQWFNTIVKKYTDEPQRIVHNLALLEMKCDFIDANQTNITISDAIIFAIAFQYYHFDAKGDCSADNFKVFDEFAKDAGLPADHVSVCSMTIL